MADHGEHTGYIDGVLFAKDILPIPVAVRVCGRCGVVVADENLHDIDHAQRDAST